MFEMKINKEKWCIVFAKLIEYKPNDENKKYLKKNAKNKYQSLFEVVGYAIKNGINANYRERFDNKEDAEAKLADLQENRYVDFENLRKSGVLWIGSIKEWLIQTDKNNTIDMQDVLSDSDMYLTDDVDDLIKNYGIENISGIFNQKYDMQGLCHTVVSCRYFDKFDGRSLSSNEQRECVINPLDVIFLVKKQRNYNDQLELFI